MMQCPQCGTQFERGDLQFCPNPSCGYPIEFAEEPAAEPEAPAMQRRPGEQAAAPPPPEPAAPPPPPPAPVPPPSPSPPRPKRRFPVVPVAIAGGVAVVLVVILVLVLSGGGSPSPGSSSSPSASHTSPSPSVTGGGPVVLHWAAAAGGEAVFGGAGDQTMNRVIHGGPGFIGVGQDGGPGDAAVWTSTDGLTWTRVVSASGVFGGTGAQFMNGVALNGNTVVAAGFSGLPGSLDAAVWVSDASASNWARVSDPVLGGPGDQVINRVEAIGPGFVAVGYTISGGNADAAVWESTDGTHWTKAQGEVGAFTGPGDQRIRSVAQLGSRLVAVGFDHAGGEDDGAVWVADGGVWRRIPPQESLGGSDDQQMITVIASGHRLVAVGYSGTVDDTDVAAWVSADGLTWEREDPGTAVFGGPGNQVVYSIAKTAQGLFAVGSDGLHGGVWRSADGTTWTRDPTDPAFGGTGEQVLRAVAYFRGLLLTSGRDSAGGDFDAAVWTSPLPVPER